MRKMHSSPEEVTDKNKAVPNAVYGQTPCYSYHHDGTRPQGIKSVQTGAHALTRS